MGVAHICRGILDRLTYLFVSAAFACKAYLRTGESSQTKWEKVIGILQGKDDFRQCTLPAWSTLRQKFYRMSKGVEVKTALKSEGANLSGLQLNDFEGRNHDLKFEI